MAAESMALHLVSPEPRCGRFGALLRRYRLRSGHSQNSLALAVGVNPSYVNRMESGERTPPSREIALALARGMALEQWQEDRLLVAAGYAPAFCRDRTVRQVAALLQGDAVLAAALRAQISAWTRMVREGDEG